MKEIEFVRNCPICGNEISHKTKHSRNQCEKDERACRSCASKLRYQKFGSCIDKVNAEVKSGVRKNGFHGKKHTTKTKELITESRLNNSESYKTKEFRDKMSKISSGENNPMYGKSLFDVWVGKYGIDEAERRTAIWKKKISLKTSGKNNPMYGKESPHKCGKGVSGWYNNFYFRSLHELQFILICERFNLKITSAEKTRIKYVSYTGNERTYSPDYYVGNHLLVEVKPLRLQSTPLNVLKFESAKKYSADNNLKFKVVDYGIPKQDQIDYLIENKIIVLN